MNGPRNGPHHGRQGGGEPSAPAGDKSKRTHNYKLIVDPALHKGQQKLYRIDGVIPGDPTSKVIVTDPRSRVARFLTKSKQADLLVPQFKVDEFYVGIPPPREVTFVNLNDNINSDFLRKMVQDLGRIDECSVCYNPQNNKHLGIAKVVFETTKSAKLCAEKFNQTSKMGNTMTVFTDPLGKERQGYIDEKVYGIPRRQVDYKTDFNPKPEIYVEPSNIPTERSNTPHIPSGLTPHVPHDAHMQNDYGEYSDHEGQGYQEGLDDLHNDHLQQPISTTDYNHKQLPPEHLNHVAYPDKRVDDRTRYGNGHREELDRTDRDHRYKDMRDYRRDHRDDHNTSRDLYNDRDRDRNRYGRRDSIRDNRDSDRGSKRGDDRVADRGNDRGGYNDRRDRIRDRYDGRRRDDRGSLDSRSRDRDSERHYGRGQTISRHGRDSPHHREPLPSRTNHQHSELDQHLGRDLRDREPEEVAQSQPPPELEPVLNNETAECTPQDEDNSPSAEAGALDLDSRIMMMLNLNKDLAGFGAPEPVIAPSGESSAAAAVLESQLPAGVPPQSSQYPSSGPPVPPSLDASYANGYPPPHMPPGYPAVPPPVPGSLGAPGVATSHVNMPPPVPPGWQPHAPPVPPSLYGVPGYPPDHEVYPPHEGGYEYIDQQGYTDYEQEPEHEQVDYADAFETSLEDLITDLKEIMNKDLCKKMVTQSAFKFFENWWSGEQNKSKSFKVSDDSQSNDAASRLSDKSISVPSTSADSNPAPSLTSFSSLFDGSSIFGGGGSSGSLLGMGAGLPKMPSFRRKISPTRELELQREKEEKERIKERGEEEDRSSRKRGRGGRVIKRRGGSVSSGQESDSSSSSASGSGSDSESDSEDEAKSKQGSSSSSSSSESSSSEESDESESEASAESQSETEDKEEEKEKEKKTTTSKKKSIPKKPSVAAKSKTVIESSSGSESESESDSETKKLARDVTPVPSDVESDVDTETTTATADKTIPTKVKPVSPQKVSKSPVKDKTKKKEDEEEPMDTTASEDTSQDTTTPANVITEKPADPATPTEPAVPTVPVEGEDGEVDLEEDKDDEPKPNLYVMVEHAYCRPPSEAPTASPRKEKKRGRPTKYNKELQDVTNVTAPAKKGNRELDRLLKDIPSVVEKPEVKPIIPANKFQVRDNLSERGILFDIFNHGVDAEDLTYFMKCYEKMLATDDMRYDWCNDTHWVEHSITNIPDPASPPPAKKSRRSSSSAEPYNVVHKTGSARTQGYYKISAYEKSKYMTNAQQYASIAGKAAANSNSEAKVAAQNIQREARTNQRRLATAFGDLNTGELLKFNQLKFRKKALRFCKSSIHDWGLYACEPIIADTMVIEYVGAVLRHSVADEREKGYERVGIGSSYLFRIDSETVIDATKCGNLARFVNHSCDPNCYARVITVDGAKKIVIYSRRKISMDEEITYDYKFPYEDEKIPCLCGAATCRGFLN